MAYADVLFVINFIMNSFVIWVTAKILRSKRKLPWLVLAGGIMAVLYTMRSITPQLRGVNNALASIVILAIGVAIAFVPRSLADVLKPMAVAYAISFTIGGLVMSLGMQLSFNWYIMGFGTLLSYVLIKLGLAIAARGALAKEMLVDVKIFYSGHVMEMVALVDTGHSLTDPITGDVVIIANTPPLSDDAKIRYVPFKSLGCQDGLLPVFRPEWVDIGGKRATNLLIGRNTDKLVADNRYQGIIPPHII